MLLVLLLTSCVCVRACVCVCVCVCVYLGHAMYTVTLLGCLHDRLRKTMASPIG